VLYPQCQRGSHGCGRGNADCDFQPRRRPKRTESGLSEGHFEFKSFTIIVSRNRTGSRRNIADRERTGRARRNPAKFFRMWWPGTELNRRRQPFQGCALPPELPGHVSKPALRAAGCEDRSLHAGCGRDGCNRSDAGSVRNVFDYSNAEGFPQRGLPGSTKSFTTERRRKRDNLLNR
jgi:hypothetical protein